MGLFKKNNKSEVCNICGLVGEITLSDGCICKQCFESAYNCKAIFKKYSDFSVQETKNAISRNNNLKTEKNNLKVTDIINFVKFDDYNMKLIINDKLFKYEDLIDFELIEDGKTLVTKGGLGAAITGGILFGGVGAVVGSVVGKKSSTEYVKKMMVRLTFKTNFRPVYEDVNFLLGKTSKESRTYKLKLDEAKSLLLKLESIKSK